MTKQEFGAFVIDALAENARLLQEEMQRVGGLDDPYTLGMLAAYQDIPVMLNEVFAQLEDEELTEES